MTGQNVDLHMTALATWLVRTVGNALMWAALTPIAGGILAVALHAPGVLWVALVLSPLVFAYRLMGATAPFPTDVGETPGRPRA